MSFPINWLSAPDDDPTHPFFPDVPGWTKVINSSPQSIVSTPADGWDFSFVSGLSLIPWTDPGNASANDGVNSASVVTGTSESSSECLYASQWNFAIPPLSTIQAVLVSINGVLYDIANTGDFPPGPTIKIAPFSLHVDSGWQYLGGSGSGDQLDTLPTGQKFSDGSWDGTPTLVGTDKLNFTDPASAFPLSAGGLLPVIGITLTPAQVNDPEFGIGLSLLAQEGPS